jgi:hypothetical protein
MANIRAKIGTLLTEENINELKMILEEDGFREELCDR